MPCPPVVVLSDGSDDVFCLRMLAYPGVALRSCREMTSLMSSILYWAKDIISSMALFSARVSPPKVVRGRMYLLKIFYLNFMLVFLLLMMLSTLLKAAHAILINQSNFYGANILDEARHSGVTAESVFNSKIDEIVL